MSPTKQYEMLVRFVIDADDLIEMHGALFEPDEGDDTVTDPKVALADVLQAALYDVESGICMEGEFRVLEVRRIDVDSAEGGA